MIQIDKSCSHVDIFNQIGHYSKISKLGIAHLHRSSKQQQEDAYNYPPIRHLIVYNFDFMGDILKVAAFQRVSRLDLYDYSGFFSVVEHNKLTFPNLTHLYLHQFVPIEDVISDVEHPEQQFPKLRWLSNGQSVTQFGLKEVTPQGICLPNVAPKLYVHAKTNEMATVAAAVFKHVVAKRLGLSKDVSQLICSYIFKLPRRLPLRHFKRHPDNILCCVKREMLWDKLNRTQQLREKRNQDVYQYEKRMLDLESKIQVAKQLEIRYAKRVKTIVSQIKSK